MKKIILSVAVAAMALATTASALEDIKVNGQTKLWYETDNAEQSGTPGDMFNKTDASAEVVFKLSMTGKQGDIGFGTTVYQASTMGLETSTVAAGRTNTDGAMFTGEAYVTAPMGSDTTLKFGKQELNTPLAFTEKWNAIPNTFNAAVAINKSVENLTLIGAYVGQDNATNWKVDGEVTNQYTGAGSTLALGALYKTDAMAVNAWYYSLENAATAFWADAAMNVTDGVNVKAYLAMMTPTADGADSTLGYALSASAKVSGVSIFAAASMVGEDDGGALSNTSTGGKKTKLPTAGVYTDGLYVALPGSTAVKVKAVTKVGSTKLIAQIVSNTNSLNDTKDTMEIDVIAIQKVGDFNIKGIVMNRSFSDTATNDGSGGLYVRAVVALNF